MTHPDPLSLEEILEALARHAADAGRTLRLATSAGGTTSIEGGVDAEGSRDARAADLFRRAIACGVLAVDAHPDGRAALYAPRFGILCRPSVSPPPRAEWTLPILHGADLRLPDGAALLCLPDAMPAHQRLAEADLPARIRPGTRTHALRLWAWSARVGVVLPEGPSLVLLSLARAPADRNAMASLLILPRPETP
jgi:hypothetical protein